MSDETKMRRIIIEVPADVTLEEEEMESLATQFKSQLVDTKSEELMVQAQAKQKQKEVPVIVQAKEVAVPKQKQQVV